MINVVECKLACVWNISIHVSSFELVTWLCMLVTLFGTLELEWLCRVSIWIPAWWLMHLTNVEVMVIWLWFKYWSECKLMCVSGYILYHNDMSCFSVLVEGLLKWEWHKGWFKCFRCMYMKFHVLFSFLLGLNWFWAWRMLKLLFMHVGTNLIIVLM